MKELQGTEKQVIWANSIREEMVRMFDEKIEELQTDKKATKGEVIRSKEYFPETKTVAETRITYIETVKEIKEAILKIENANWFIGYKGIDVEFCVDNYFSTNTGSAFPKANR